MKITQKLYSFIFLALILIMVPYSLIAYQREVSLFETDMKRDASLLGKALSPILADAWENGGKNKVDEVIRAVNAHEQQMLVRWVWLNKDIFNEYKPLLADTQLERLTAPAQVLAVRQSEIETPQLVTYVAVQPNGLPLGAIELVESLDAMRAYTKSTIVYLFLLSSFLTFSGALFMAVGGHFLVTRRVNLLVQQARDIGQEHYGSPLRIRSKDELAKLGKELLQMSDKLQQKRAQLVSENLAKLEIKEQLRHAERLKMLGQLASGIAHELGTPLNVVLGRAKLMATVAEPQGEVEVNADIIQKQVMKMSNMINQLLNFARRQTPQKSRFVVNERLLHLVKLLKPIASKEGVKLVVLDKTSDLSINADWQQVEQVLSNLIVNGIQAMLTGGQLTVTVEHRQVAAPPNGLSPHTTYAVVAVQDEGSGIPHEVLPQIFDPFFSTKKAGEGTGLGLSIVKDIIDEHEGWIDVKSQAGEGTCFTVFLPTE